MFQAMVRHSISPGRLCRNQADYVDDGTVLSISCVRKTILWRARRAPCWDVCVPLGGTWCLVYLSSWISFSPSTGSLSGFFHISVGEWILCLSYILLYLSCTSLRIPVPYFGNSRVSHSVWTQRYFEVMYVFTTGWSQLPDNLWMVKAGGFQKELNVHALGEIINLKDF